MFNSARICERNGADAARPVHLAPTRAGFALIELLVALSIGAILIMLALPSYGRWIAEEKLMGHARALADHMSLARSEAIKRGQRVNLCKSADGRNCTDIGDWNQGYLTHVDSDTSGEVNGPDTILRIESAVKDVHVAANRPLADYVSFTPLGSARMLNGALQMGTFTVCKQGLKPVQIVLVATGRARIARGSTICP